MFCQNPVQFATVNVLSNPIKFASINVLSNLLLLMFCRNPIKFAAVNANFCQNSVQFTTVNVLSNPIKFTATNVLSKSAASSPEHKDLFALFRTHVPRYLLTDESRERAAAHYYWTILHPLQLARDLANIVDSSHSTVFSVK